MSHGGRQAGHGPLLFSSEQCGGGRGQSDGKQSDEGLMNERADEK